MFFDFRQLLLAVQTTPLLSLEPSRYARYFQNNFGKVRLGCTFRPEDFASFSEALEALPLLRKWGIQEIRIGIRWSRVQTDYTQSLALTDYFRVLDKALTLGFGVTLTLGPVKSAGWPEQFIPRPIEDACGLQKGGQIVLGDRLSEYALDYFDRLLARLQKRYPPGSFVALQPDNECFKPFGHLALTASNPYLQTLLGRIGEAYPNTPILLNSSGRREVFQILNFWNSADISRPLIIGYNYYFVTAATAFAYPFSRYADDFVRMHFNTPSLNYTQADLTYEITELQAEPWGRAWWPGNDYRAFLYALTRAGQTSANLSQKTYTVRLWGVERLLQRALRAGLDFEQQKIIRLLEALAASPN